MGIFVDGSSPVHTDGVGSSFSGDWVGLSDTPGSVTANNIVTGNPGGTGLEFTPAGDLFPDDPLIVTVSITGGDFTSVQAAMASITDASSVKPYCIHIGPGVFVGAPFTRKAYVSLKGCGIMETVLQTNDDSAHFITDEPGGSITNLAVHGPTDVGFAAIRRVTSGFVPALIRNVAIRAGYYGVMCDPLVSRGVIHCFDVVNHYVGVTMNQFMRSIEHGNITAITSGFMSGPPSAIGTTFYCSGPDAEMTLDLCFHRNDGSTNGIWIDNGCSFKASATTLSKGTTAIRVGSVGTGTTAEMTGMIVRSGQFTTEILNQSITSHVDFQGHADESKIDNTVGSPDFSALTHNEDGQVSYGEFQIGGDLADTIPLTSYTNDTVTTGWVDGGEVSRVSGLDVAVSSGFGYVNTGTGVRKVVWGAVASLGLTASAENYIYVNSAGVVSVSLSEPDEKLNIILSVAHTTTSAVDFLATYKIDIHNHVVNFHEWVAHVLGPRPASGNIATENATPLKLDITSGRYYLADQEIVALSGTAFTWTKWYRDSPSGWKTIPALDTISTTSVDDGTGTLGTLTVAKYKKALLVRTQLDDGTDEYHLIEGQEEFADQTAAEEGAIPLMPDALDSRALRCSGIVVLQGAASIASITDELPAIGGGTSAPGAGVTDHGALSGLGDIADHPGYLDLAGTRAMTGSIDMGTNAITNVGLVDGVTVSNHSARHLPGGADALTTAAANNITVGATASEGSSTDFARSKHVHGAPSAVPVAVGTSNALGSASTFVHSDHVHAHGAQPIGTGTNHAVATPSVAGFMSAADKTSLDNSSSGGEFATIDQQIQPKVKPVLGTFSVWNGKSDLKSRIVAFHRIFLPAGTYTKMQAIVVDGVAAETFDMGVYADSPGPPAKPTGVLLASTGSISAAVDDTLHEVALSSSVVSTGGYFWLAIVLSHNNIKVTTTNHKYNLAWTGVLFQFKSGLASDNLPDPAPVTFDVAADTAMAYLAMVLP